MTFFEKLWLFIEEIFAGETYVAENPYTIKPVVIEDMPPKTQLVPEPPKKGLLIEFCLAIQEYEGYFIPSSTFPDGSRSYRNCNPGNIRCISIMNALAMGKDNSGFCIFPNYETGFQALQNLIINAVHSKSSVYHPDDTLNVFFAKYSPTSDHNNPHKYAEVVGKKLSVNPASFTIKELI